MTAMTFASMILRLPGATEFGGGDVGAIAPIIDLNGSAFGIHESGTFTEGDSSTAYIDSATVYDAEGAGLSGMTMTCGGHWGDDGADEVIAFDTWTTDANTDESSTLVVGATTFLLAYVASTGVLTITKNGGGAFPAADAQSLIRLFEYVNSSGSPTEGDRSFTWQAEGYVDGGGGGGEPETDSFQVRRSSDDTTDDFTVTELIAGDVATFVGAGDGFLPTWYDKTSNGNDVTMATTTNQPKVVLSGVTQEGVIFQSTDYMSRARITSGTVPQLTIATWLKVASSGNARNIACEMTTVNSWRYRFNSAGALEIFRSNGSFSSIVALGTGYDDNTWRHVVLVLDGANIKLYVNNSLAFEEPSDILVLAQSGSTLFELGADRQFSTLNGALSDFRIWQSALTGPDVASVYAGDDVGSPLIHLRGNYSP